MNLTCYTGIQNLGGGSLSTGITFLQANAPYGLVQNLDGSLSINPKTPATVVGELILRPLIDCTTQAFSRLWQCARTLDSLFTRAVTFPGAAAADLSQISPSQVNQYIQKLDISGLDQHTFQQIFLDNPTGAEDRRRVQLLNDEQVKTAFLKFGSVNFTPHLSASQLTMLENSLTDQEITTAVINYNSINNLLSRCDRCVKKLDISRLSEHTFRQIFLDNPTGAEDRRRIQLLNEEQVKATFHRFFGSVTFKQHLSTSQLKMLENSLTDQEITVAINKYGYSNMNNLLSQPRFNRYIQGLDITQLSESQFKLIFSDNPTGAEDRRRFQLLNDDEQVKAAFHRFFGSVTFKQHLSTSQLTMLENSLTDQEITASINKFGYSNMNNLLSQSRFNRYIQGLDITQLSESQFKLVFIENPTSAEDKRRIQLLNEEQIKAAHKKFSGMGSFQQHLSPNQIKVVNTPQSDTLTKQKAEAPIKPKETISEKTATKKTIQNIPIEEDCTDNSGGEPIKQDNMKRHITFGTTYVKGNSQRDALSRLIDENHREYASLWNLKHRVVKDSLLKDQCTHNQKIVDCVPYWNKVAVLREWVNKPAINPNSEEWYVLADDDMPVTNMKVDPYKAIDLLRGNVDTSIVIVRDIQLWKNNDEQLSVNTGLLFVRKDANSKKFIEDLWRKRNTATGSRNQNCPTLGTCQNQEVLHEQEAFAQLIQEDRSLLGRVITVVKPRDTYHTTLCSSEEIALNTFNREGCFRRQQDHWGTEKFSYDSDKSYHEGKWREGDWMGQTAGVPVNGWWCGDYDRNLPPGPIRKDMLKNMLSRVVR